MFSPKFSAPHPTLCIILAGNTLAVFTQKTSFKFLHAQRNAFSKPCSYCQLSKKQWWDGLSQIYPSFISDLYKTQAILTFLLPCPYLFWQSAKGGKFNLLFQQYWPLTLDPHLGQYLITSLKSLERSCFINDNLSHLSHSRPGELTTGTSARRLLCQSIPKCK